MKSQYIPLSLLLPIVCSAQSATAQQTRRPALVRPQEQPLPAGQEIYARDGDRVIIEDNARVRVITRYTGYVRMVYSADQHWLIVMIDSSSPDGGGSDGKPERNFTFTGLEGEWPMESRWEGYGTVDQYGQSAAPFRPGGAGIVTPAGLIQLFPGGPPIPVGQDNNMYRDASARSVLTHRGSGNGNGGMATFDRMEQSLVTAATRMAQGRPGVTGMRSPTGGNTSVPRKIVDVAPTYPDVARRANITAVVIVEITVAADGTVSNARVVRSVPLLDEPALEAVRQWRYAPAVVNGQAVPVVLTVTVPFSPQ